MAESIKIDNNVLQGYLSQYKAEFSKIRAEEMYKWQAVKCFQDNWDIDATDFPAMLKSALAKTGNLLASAQFFPKKMIEGFADAEPETVRKMFRELFDESQDVEKRVAEFESSATKLLEGHPTWRMTYQNPNSISTYLWLRYPDKYYIYKYTLARDNARKLCHVDMPGEKYARMRFAFDLYNTIRDEIDKDKALVRMSTDNLSLDCYPDNSLTTLVIDICYYIGRHEMIELGNHGKVLDKNIILCGPPGTGKTYSVIHYAVAIIEDKPLAEIMNRKYEDVFERYRKHKDDGLVEFITFHQSFGYEEFIEGIRPTIADGESADASGDIEYEIHDGVFKQFCDQAEVPLADENGADLGIGKNPTVWKVSLEGTGDNPTRGECLENNHIRIGWDGYGPHLTDELDYTRYGGKRELNAFYNKMQIGDIVMSCYSSRLIDAVGVIVGDAEWGDETYDGYRRLRKVRWLAKGLREDIVDRNSGKTLTLSTVYRLSISVSDALDIVKRENPSIFGRVGKPRNRVFIIDEINRGNISKIFGELITLIESSKRIGTQEEMRVTLPYSGRRFGVPDHVYIIGTMNTADRSIALMDTALRRRFKFVEMQPEPKLLNDVVVNGIDIAEVLDTINKRITVLFDRDHTIGHSYLLPLRRIPTFENLADIFENRIFPLLQEYFHDDYEKIRLVLGDERKDDDSICFVVKKSDAEGLFGNTDGDLPEYYDVNKEAFTRIEAYANLV